MTDPVGQGLNAVAGLAMRGHGLMAWLSRQGATAHSVALMTGASAAGQVAVLLTLPFVSRLYDPVAFGIHALLASFVGLLSVGVCLCLDVAIVSAPSDLEADELFAGALMSIPITVAFGVVVMWTLIVFDVLNYGQVPLWGLPLVALLICSNGFYFAARHRRLQESNFRVIAKTNLVLNIARATAPLAIYPLLPTWAGLTFAELLSRCLGAYQSMASLWSRRNATKVWGRLNEWLRMVRRNYRYSAILLASVSVDAAAFVLIAPVIATTYGLVSAGTYYLVNLALAAPFALVGAAIGDVIHAKGGRLFHAARDRLPGFLTKAAVILSALACAVYLPIFLLAPQIFPILFGGQWPDLVAVVQAMIPLMLVAFVASPCSRLLLVVGNTSLKAWSDILRLSGILVTLYTSHALNLSFPRAMWNLSWFLGATYCLYFFLTFLAVQRASRRL